MGGPLATGAIDLIGAPIGPAFSDIYSQSEVEVFQESFSLTIQAYIILI